MKTIRLTDVENKWLKAVVKNEILDQIRKGLSGVGVIDGEYVDLENLLIKLDRSK